MPANIDKQYDKRYRMGIVKPCEHFRIDYVISFFYSLSWYHNNQMYWRQHIGLSQETVIIAPAAKNHRKLIPNGFLILFGRLPAQMLITAD